MTIFVGSDPSAQIVGRSHVNIVIVESEKIHVPHGVSLPALLRSFVRHPSPQRPSTGLPPEARLGAGVAHPPKPIRWPTPRSPLGGPPPEARLGAGWRREWDSNPRYAFTHTRFPSVRLKPLGHPSADVHPGGAEHSSGPPGDNPFQPWPFQPWPFQPWPFQPWPFQPWPLPALALRRPGVLAGLPHPRAAILSGYRSP